MSFLLIRSLKQVSQIEEGYKLNLPHLPKFGSATS
jgi:hypothetical protein